MLDAGVDDAIALDLIATSGDAGVGGHHVAVEIMSFPDQ